MIVLINQGFGVHEKKTLQAFLARTSIPDPNNGFSCSNLYSLYAFLLFADQKEKEIVLRLLYTSLLMEI